MFLKVRTVLLLSLTGSTLFAQTPTIVPLAPEAAALAKEVNYPANLNTGVVNISIPLYEVVHGGMTLPIALNYHAGGFRSNERSTSIGLGFSLSCDIQITRSINGLDDFAPSKGYIANADMKAHIQTSTEDNYPLNVDPSSYPEWQQAYRIANGLIDGMPDKFNYRLLNKSGSFYFQKDISGRGYKIVTAPYDNTIRIFYSAGETTSYFTIIDSNGDTYYFGGPGALEQMTNATSDTPYTSWKCREIVNATKTESFHFSYINKSPMRDARWPERIEYVNDPQPCGLEEYYTSKYISTTNPSIDSYEELVNVYPFLNLSSPKFTEYFGVHRLPEFHLPHLNAQNLVVDVTYPVLLTNNASSSSTTSLALSEISFRDGKVIFSGTDKLNSITIKDAYGSEVKRFVFSQSYAVPGGLATARAVNGQEFNGTLYLDAIEVKNQEAVIEKYNLQYGEKFCFGNHLVGKDAWGYVNDYTVDISASGIYRLESRIPRQQIIQQVTTVADNQQVGCSKVDGVTFTVGNSTNTEVPSSRASVGMLNRIVYPTGGYVDFQYEPNKYKIAVEDGYAVRTGGGLRIRSMTYFDGKWSVAAHQKYYRYGDLEEGIGQTLVLPEKDLNLASYEYKPYSYSSVTSYMTTGRRDVKTTIYEPASSLNYNYQTGAPIYYTTVTEYNSDLGVNTGKTVHTFFPPGKFCVVNPHTKIDQTNVDVLHSDGLMGQLQFLRHYKYDNGNYSLVHSKEYEYTKYNTPEQVKVVFSYQKIKFEFDGSSGYWDQIRKKEFVNSHFYEMYALGEYGIEVGKLLLASEKEQWIKEGETLTNVTNYYYDNTHYLQPSRIVTTNSMGEQLTKTLQYPYDFFEDVYRQMVGKNMIGTPVEEIVYNNTRGKEISRIKTNFGQIDISPGISFQAPVSVQKSFGGAALQTLLTYDKYDAYANVLQITGKDKIPVTYLWGYDRRYPIAEIKGAIYDQVASVTSSPVGFETLLTSSDSEVIQAGVSDRKHVLPLSLTTIFTHKPLTGIRSMTDPSGMKNYFEYDYAGRLQAKKDENGDITKAYNYNVLNVTAGLAANPWYLSNAPVMETFSFLCYHNVPVTQFPFNYVVDGGKYVGYMGSDPDWDAVQEMRSATPGYVPPAVDCSTTAEKIQLYSRGIASAYLDLIRDGAIVYSKPFPRHFTNPEDYYTPNEFYVPAGEYQLSLRLEGNSSKGLVRFSLDNGTSVVNVHPGEIFNVAPGVTNSFIIYVEGE